MPNTLVPRTRLWAGITALLIAGCAGGGDASDPSEGAGRVEEPTAGEQSAAAGGSGGGGPTIGEVTLTADPGSAWAEVDGGRLEYQASGGVAYECTVANDRVAVNFQTADGHDLFAQGGKQGDDWFMSLTFKPGAGDQIQYGFSSVDADGTIGISDGALSYEGQVDRIEDFDVENATKVDARVAVNCASAGGDGSAGGGDPTATIGGQSYTFALSGAQSVTCEVAPDNVTVRINRLAIDGTQLEIDGRQDSDRWIGAVVVYTSDGNYTSPMANDGTGLTIDGSSVQYEGSFKAPDGSELDGTASAACP